MALMACVKSSAGRMPPVFDTQKPRKRAQIEFTLTLLTSAKPYSHDGVALRRGAEAQHRNGTAATETLNKIKKTKGGGAEVQKRCVGCVRGATPPAQDGVANGSNAHRQKQAARVCVQEGGKVDEVERLVGRRQILMPNILRVRLRTGQADED